MDENRLNKIIKEIPEKFFFEESFEKPGYAASILAEIPLSYKKVEHNDLFKCSPLLTKKQEYLLFRKLNYLKYKLVKITKGFAQNDKSPSPKPCKEQNLKKLKNSGLTNLEKIISEISDVRNIILKANTRLIAKQAKKMSKNPADADDLISIGCLDIIKIINNFDYRRGLRFSTYCIRSIQTNLWRYQKRQYKIRPADKEIKIEKIYHNDFSEINEKYKKQTAEKVFEIIRKNMKHPMQKIEVIKHHYGFDDKEPMNLKEVGDKMNLSRERIRQIKREVFSELSKFKILHDPI
jgi:RNA polymerase primary sigma factor/RNA polymerase sigma factor